MLSIVRFFWTSVTSEFNQNISENGNNNVNISSDIIAN